MVRLTVLSQSPAAAVLRVEGWVAEEEVSLLGQEGERLLAGSSQLVLELDRVEFVDAAGLALLRGWSGPRLRLRDGSPFIRGLLARHGLHCEERSDHHL